MKFSSTTAAVVLLAGNALAGPLPARGTNNMVDIIGQIAPTAAACDTTQYPECRTPSQMAPFVNKAMQKYGVTSPGEKAGVLALTAYESVDFKYKHNVSPGRPGQGTSNMQMFDFNQQYANSIPELKAKVTAIGDTSTDEAKNKVLALVKDDKYNFASGQWFLTTKCSDEVRKELATGSDAGFEAYITQCVGTTMTADRTKYWNDAKAAFGINNATYKFRRHY